MPSVLSLFLVLASTALSKAEATSIPSDPERAALDEAIGWIKAATGTQTEFDYTMTAKIRLLLFWVGKDDVGGGYIRLGNSGAIDGGQPGTASIEVLFGSDPDKAPRRINRWGSATEVLQFDHSKHGWASAFFGFMKSSGGQSVSQMQEELASEQSLGRHRFEAIVSRAGPDGAVSRVVPLYSDEDFTLHQFPLAQNMIMSRLGEQARLRRLEGPAYAPCVEEGGFLFAVRSLIEAALTGKPTPQSACYVYNARRYTASLKRVTPIAEKTVTLKLRNPARTVERTYRDLVDADFEVVNHDNGDRTSFELAIASSGPLRGVPVQITHQPNWWFKVVLSLLPRS